MLDTLRKKSERTRIMITIGASLGITIAIASFWVWSVSGRFAKADDQTPDSSRPFAMIGSIFNDAKNEIGSLRNNKVTEDVTDSKIEPVVTPETQVLEESYVGSSSVGLADFPQAKERQTSRPIISNNDTEANSSEDAIWNSYTNVNTVSDTEIRTTINNNDVNQSNDYGPSLAPLPNSGSSPYTDTSINYNTYEESTYNSASTSSDGPPLAPLPGQ